MRELTALELIVWEVLSAHVGPQNRIGRRELLARVRERAAVGDRTLRRVVSDLVVVHGRMIGSDPRSGGYWVCGTKREALAAARTLLSYVADIARRAEALRRAAAPAPGTNRDDPQLRLL